MQKTTHDPIEISKFAEQAANWWDTQGPFKTLHDINPVRLNFIKKYTTLKDSRILDIGCGGGILSEAMAKAGGRVTGIDAEAFSIEAAAQHAKQNNVAVDYVHILAEQFNAKPFDRITCMELLEHVADPYFLLEQAARLIKPGGYLFLSTINRTLKAYAAAVIAAEYILQLLPRQTHDYKKFIKPSELRAMLNQLGFETIDLQGLYYNPLTRHAGLHASVSVNYLLACRRR